MQINNICRFSRRLRKKSTVVAGFSTETAININMQISSENDILLYIFISVIPENFFFLKIILQGKEMFLT